jgi:hypothetical protein
MSKATITYDLFDPEDREDFMRATKALDMASCLFAIQNVMRSYRKKDHSDEVGDVIDNITEELYDLYNDFGIDLDKLIT